MHPLALPWLGRVFAFVAVVLSVTSQAFAQAQLIGDPLAFDTAHKRITARSGETNAVVTFAVTNNSRTPVIIHDVVPSCGCSVATLPAKPWTIRPGERGAFSVATDVRGKTGSLLKTVVVQSSAGARQLTYQVDILEPASPADRARNQSLAKTDRQAVFKGECARCHAEPARGKLGKELFTAACGICHEAEHRATMVPDLRTLKKPTSLDYWVQWIAHGKAATLMPAFWEMAGGPLTDRQIYSLAEFLSTRP